MPVRVPRRENMRQAYQVDPPISEVGRIMAQIFARELVTRNAVPKAIYTSPSLACVQTAADIRNFIGNDCGGICIEPGLATNQCAASSWMSPSQFNQLKYNVEENYTPEQQNQCDRSMNGRSDNLKKLLFRLSQKGKGVALFITDPLGLRFVTDQGGMGGNENEEQARAACAFPPMSSVVLVSNSQRGGLEPSRLYMRPLTTIGETSRPEIEVNTDARAKQ
ncbi:hypothetical protein COOONC_12304 [Cooperia oncophora]